MNDNIMKEINQKLKELNKKADTYMVSKVQSLRDVGSGMKQVINEITELMNPTQIHIEAYLQEDELNKILTQIKQEVLIEVGVEGVKADMSLKYNNAVLTKGICEGGRTNKAYFDKVISTLENMGYKRANFKIEVA